MIPYGPDPFLTVNMLITMATTYFDEHFDGHGDVTIWRYAWHFLRHVSQFQTMVMILSLFSILWDHITRIIFFSSFLLTHEFRPCHLKWFQISYPPSKIQADFIVVRWLRCKVSYIHSKDDLQFYNLVLFPNVKKKTWCSNRKSSSTSNIYYK